MRQRIRDLKQRLESVQARRERTMERRPWPLVSIVGYTNAGKSTLLNAFAARADAYVDDRLFATLDTKSRLVRLPDQRDALLTDTVGFIRNLPHDLIASFRSTLDEVRSRFAAERRGRQSSLRDRTLRSGVRHAARNRRGSSARSAAFQ